MNFVIEDGTEGKDLVVTGEWTHSARKALERGRADGLVLNYARGFHEQPIGFIEGLPIRRLNVLARSVADLSPIYSLASTLEVLRVQSDPQAILEIERLPLLKTLAISWPQVQGSIMYGRRIENLSIPSYGEHDLTPLTELSALTSLTMKEHPKLRSLDGVTELPWLSSLGIFVARNLHDITALARAQSPVLKILQFGSCKKIQDIAPVVGCPSLRFFELSEGNEIPTVKPLGGLSELDRLYMYGSTKVADGDLSPIAQLPKLRDFRMVNRRNYKPSTSAINELLRDRALI